MNQLAQMKTMLSSFLGPRQETTRTAFCNYLASEVEALEDKDVQTFRNETVKLLSSIQSRADERNCDPSTSAQMQFQYLCHRHFHSHSIQHCQGIHLNHPRDSVDNQQLTAHFHTDPIQRQLSLPQAKKVNTTYQDSQASLATNRMTHCSHFHNPTRNNKLPLL